MDYVGVEGEKICGELNLFSDGKVVFIGEDRWAEEGVINKNLPSHKLGAGDLKIEIEYLKNVEVDEEGKVGVCLVAKNPGVYHGIILYRIEGNPAGVGSWLELNISKRENVLGRITGSVTGLDGDVKKGVVLFSMTFFEVVVLVGLVFVGRGRGVKRPR